MLDNQDKQLHNISLVTATSAASKLEMESFREDYHGMNRFMILIIAAALIPWLFGDYKILGFNITGWAWVIPTIISGIICIRNIKYITFPIRLWLIWISFMLFYFFLGFNNPDALQSLFQMLSPFIIGCAASIFLSDFLQLENIIIWIKRLAIIAWAILIIRVPMILTGMLPGHGFMVAEMIGLLLLGACYSSFYACGNRQFLYYYLSMILITFISLTRGPMTAMLSCMPLNLTPMGTGKRIILLTLSVICAIVIFNTDRIQQRMFQSGSGRIADIRLDNPNFKTTGRSYMWDILRPGIEEKPLFGNGWNYHRVALPRAGLHTYAPHNDWLKLMHDLGIIGISVYALTMIMQVFWLVRIARMTTGAHQMLAYGSATAFIPYALIMFTDNVVLYVQFFGNLHFALIGIVYATPILDEV